MTVNKIQTNFELGFDLPALPGMAVSDIQTPCLIIDMESFDDNLKRMAEVITPYNVSLRPHAKMHKSIDVARQQLAQDKTNGICCQKVSEAEVFARAGIPDILITNQVCDQAKIERLAGIAALGCRLSVCVDNKVNINALSAEAKKRNVHIHCLVELDCGAGRCGVENAEQATELSVYINEAEHLIFDGLQAYQGSIQHELDHEQRKTE
ncbi:MAG: alanine racemase, partial [Alphaproteobacteria bacterium]|nr:alanine racemase [Alphaproteobacteria bacterium]